MLDPGGNINIVSYQQSLLRTEFDNESLVLGTVAIIGQNFNDNSFPLNLNVTFFAVVGFLEVNAGFGYRIWQAGSENTLFEENPIG